MKKINKVKIIVFAGILRSHEYCIVQSIVHSRGTDHQVLPVSQTPVYLAGFRLDLLWEVSADFWEI